MVPSAYVLLERIPLSANGKIDHRALPAPQPVRPASDAGFVAPRTRTEKLLAEIWAETLHLDRIGVHDSFFELGGNSLLAAQLIARVRTTFPVDLSLRSFFEDPTIANIARAITTPAEQARPARAQALPPNVVAIQSGGAQSPLFCVHPVAGVVFPYYELAGLLGQERPVYGFQSVGIAGEGRPLNRVEAMAEHYLAAMRQIQPEGPYTLVGWSFGAVVAFEMAQQLCRQGQHVGLLAMIDPPPNPAIDRLPTILRSYRYMFGMVGPQLWPYVYDYLFLSASNSPGRAQEPRPRRLQALLGAVGLRRPVAAQTKLASYRRPELGRLLQAIRANIQASRHYAPPLYPGHITFLQSDAGQGDLNLIARWQRLAAGGASVYTIRGHHLDMLRRPHVAELAKRLEACLDQAQPENSFDS